MNYEVKSRINWLVVLSDVVIGSIFMTISSLFSGFDIFLDTWVFMVTILALVILWRMQSYKIIADDTITFKRLLFKDYEISFEEIESIKFYDDKKNKPFAIKRAFLEIDTKKSYFTYYLDHFDLDEINELFTSLARKYGINYEGTSNSSSLD